MKQNTKNANTDFYNRYHEKNDLFFEIIKENNFTYFYIQKALNVILNRKEIRDCLDIGCGVGTIAFYLSKKGVQVDGFDVSERAIDIANHFKRISKHRNVDFHNKDVQMQEFKKTYDLVICTEVIEHLKNDARMLKTISKAMNKNGYLLLSTPSQNAPLFKLGLLKKFDSDVGHLRRYKMEELTLLAEKSGFSVERQFKVESLMRNALFTFPILGNFIRLIKGPLIPLFHMFDDVLTIIFGESDLIIVARKP